MTFQTADPSRDSLKREVSAICREVLRLESLQNDQEMFILGYDQLLGARLLRSINEQYGTDIKPSVLRDALTVAKLVDLIQMKQASADYQCIVPIRTEGSLPPLYLIHGVGGNVLGFFDLARKMPAEQPVYGIQAQSLYSQGRVLLRLTDMAACYLQEIRRIQPKGPYHFMGLSFGGLVAYEMAQQLRSQGEEVGLLGLLDTWHPALIRVSEPGGFQRSRLRGLPQFSALYSNISKLSLLSKLAYLSVRLKTRTLRMYYHYSAATGKANITELMTSVREINGVAGLYYEPMPYEGAVTLFRADEEYSDPLPEDLGWESLACGGLQIYHFPEDHGRVLAEPGVSKLAESITACLGQMHERKDKGLMTDRVQSNTFASELAEREVRARLHHVGVSVAGTSNALLNAARDEIEI